MIFTLLGTCILLYLDNIQTQFFFSIPLINSKKFFSKKKFIAPKQLDKIRVLTQKVAHHPYNFGFFYPFLNYFILSFKINLKAHLLEEYLNIFLNKWEYFPLTHLFKKSLKIISKQQK
jgi:hypothetical protein